MSNEGIEQNLKAPEPSLRLLIHSQVRAEVVDMVQRCSITLRVTHEGIYVDTLVETCSIAPRRSRDYDRIPRAFHPRDSARILGTQSRVFRVQRTRAVADDARLWCKWRLPGTGRLPDKFDIGAVHIERRREIVLKRVWVSQDVGICVLPQINHRRRIESLGKSIDLLWEMLLCGCVSNLKASVGGVLACLGVLSLKLGFGVSEISWQCIINFSYSTSVSFVLLYTHLR